MQGWLEKLHHPNNAAARSTLGSLSLTASYCFWGCLIVSLCTGWFSLFLGASHSFPTCIAQPNKALNNLTARAGLLRRVSDIVWPKRLQWDFFAKGKRSANLIHVPWEMQLPWRPKRPAWMFPKFWLYVFPLLVARGFWQQLWGGSGCQNMAQADSNRAGNRILSQPGHPNAWPKRMYVHNLHNAKTLFWNLFQSFWFGPPLQTANSCNEIPTWVRPKPAAAICKGTVFNGN